MEMSGYKEEKKECSDTPESTTSVSVDKNKKSDDDSKDESSSWASGPPPLATLELSSDQALGHSTAPRKSERGFGALLLRLSGHFLRLIVLDFPLVALFACYVGAVLLHRIHDDYLLPQIKLMKFIEDGRDYLDTTYYHRVCNDKDITARSIDELVIGPNATTQDAVENMLTHGASMYPNLLTPETAWALRDFIAEENHKQDGWFVIENELRYSWGIDMDMHPALRTFWKELGSNVRLVKALEAIVGPDPAIIEFTAITAAYGAKTQYDHQDVVPPASGVKFARTFVPSYSLFIPLQDTSFDMGATHICPGTHLCSYGMEKACPGRNLAVSGDDVWPQGWGALVNQQTTHKGTGHTKKGALDRVVIIATFAPRPQTYRALETRMLGQGGSYSIKWDHWGHTLSDFVHSEQRMTPLKRAMRSLGLLKGKGWNMISVASMRISNNDNGYNSQAVLKRFIKAGGFWFVPSSWQGPIEEEEPEDDNVWYEFLIGTLKTTEQELRKINIVAIVAYIVALCVLDLILFVCKWSKGSVVVRSIPRVVVTHGSVLLLAMYLFHTVKESNWGKDIQSYKMHRIPVYELVDEMDLVPETIPTSSDVLIAPQYASDYMASYSRVLDYSHRGNMFWKDLTKKFSRGYGALPQKLQHEFCSDMIDSVRRERRFLKQDLGRSWVPVEDEDELLYFCRRALLTATHPLIDGLVRQVESLRTEAHYGRFHNSAMSLTATPSLLNRWEHRFVPPIILDSKAAGNATKPVFFPRTFAVMSSTLKATPQRTPVPRRPPPKEPFDGAWLQTGDIVEGKYNCKHNEWYKGTVVRALANNRRYYVEYDDGEVDEDLKRKKCVRRYVPYVVGDATQYRHDIENGEVEWLPGRVSRVYEDGYYDVKTKKGLVKRVPTDAMRRVEKIPERAFKVGDRVQALFQGGDEWFAGRISKKNRDGTFAVKYDDGDYERSVAPSYIQLLAASEEVGEDE